MSDRLCECHGEPMLWNSSNRKYGGNWYCSVKRRQRDAEWRKSNPDKVKARNDRRIFAGHTYLGSCGFTQAEREELIVGETD